VARGLREGLVLGADTEVHHRGRLLGKPASAAHARRMLASLSGRWHTVYSGAALVEAGSGKSWTAVASTRVLFRKLGPRELDFWSRRNHDKAGAYSAQAKRSPFVERRSGDLDTVVGLSRRAVRELLRQARKAGYVPG
jgi:septum formation protein